MINVKTVHTCQHRLVFLYDGLARVERRTQKLEALGTGRKARNNIPLLIGTQLDAGLHPAYDGIASLPFLYEYDLSEVDVLLISQCVSPQSPQPLGQEPDGRVSTLDNLSYSSCFSWLQCSSMNNVASCNRLAGMSGASVHRINANYFISRLSPCWGQPPPLPRHSWPQTSSSLPCSGVYYEELRRYGQSCTLTRGMT